MKFKTYQKQDLARLALHDGGILAWDRGLGKTVGEYTWCLLKVGLLHSSPSPLNGLRTQSRRENPPSTAGVRGEHSPSTSGVRGESDHHPRPAPAKPCLIVAPGDLHDQMADDARRLLKVESTPLMSQDDFLRLSTLNPNNSQRLLPPGFYLTSYTALAQNGVAKFPTLEDHGIEGMIERFHITTEFAGFYDARGSIYADEYLTLDLSPNATLADLEAAHRRKRRNDPTNAGRNAADKAFDILRNLQPAACPLSPVPCLSDLSPDQLRWVQCETITRLTVEYSGNIGETRELKPAVVTDHESPITPHASRITIKCVYSPTLADLSSESFAAMAVDEGVKMKGDATILGLGIRQMNPRYRLVLSGTPIKNRLPDIFHLAHWATGHHAEPCARWPYSNHPSEKQVFSEEFLLSERNLTKEQKSETGRRYVKLSPQVCNIHRLWKLFGPIIVRRLKKDIGEDIVKKHHHVIRVPMGTAQARTYQYHMEAEYKDCMGMKAIGAQLQALRTVAAAPHCGNLQRRPLPDNASILLSDFVSGQTYIPKYAAALTIIQQAMARGEQVVLFSDLLEPLHTLAARLRDAGVPHLVATGEMSPARRRKLSADFKQGPPKYASPSPSLEERAGERRPSHPDPIPQTPEPTLYPVLLASDCMAEGHSWKLANNIVHLSFSWAADKRSQAIDRCHRIDSVADLNYYAILCDGTTDLILENNLHEKDNTSDLVLDGQLMAANPEEVSLSALLASASATFSSDTRTIDERSLEMEWPALREQLRQTYKEWQGSSSKLQVVPPPSEPETCNLPPVTPLHITMHPWKTRHLRRVNLRQRSLAFA